MPKVRVAGRIGFVIAWFLLIGAGLGAGQAATRTWTGAVDGNWSTVGNWSPSGAPQNGDALIFPANGAAVGTNNLFSCN